MFRKARLKDSEQPRPKMHIEYITLSLCNEIGDWQGRVGGGGGCKHIENKGLKKI